MIRQATGQSARQRGLSSQQPRTKAASATRQRAMVMRFVPSVERRFVRGLKTSWSQSAQRLKHMAAVRALTRHQRIQRRILRVGSPWAATNMEERANGSAKTECENLISSSVPARRWKKLRRAGGDVITTEEDTEGKGKRKKSKGKSESGP